MLRRKEKIKWPRYSTWWDRNELKMNILSWGIFLALLLIARQGIVHGTPTYTQAIIWLVLFAFNLIFLSFFTNGVHRK